MHDSRRPCATFARHSPVTRTTSSSYENLAAIYYDLDSLEVATLVSQQAIQKQGERNEELAAKDLAAREDLAGRARREGHHGPADGVRCTTPSVSSGWRAVRWRLAYDAFNARRSSAIRTSLEAMFNVAGIAVNVQDYQTAYDTYQRILSMQADNREARLSLAVAARGLGNLDEAEQIYNAMLQKEPDYAPAKFNLGIPVPGVSSRSENCEDDLRRVRRDAGGSNLGGRPHSGCAGSSGPDRSDLGCAEEG